MAGLSFCDLDDATVFYNKITTQEIAPKKSSKKKGNPHFFTIKLNPIADL